MSKIKQIKRYIVKSLFIPLGPAWVISFFLGKTVSFLFFLPEFLHTNRANKTTQSISPLYTESTLYKVLHLTLFLFNCSDFPMISHVNIILPIPFQLHNVPLYYGIIINLSTIYGHLSFCSTLLQYIVLVDIYEKKSNLTHIWAVKGRKTVTRFSFRLLWIISKSFAITYNICMNNPVYISSKNVKIYLKDTLPEMGI